jgi:NAD(P)-dependent dehydrogenase (short-subunit alcohol dehydrogenase family)
VVVNDLGGALDGAGDSPTAEAVVDEIRSEGGIALANGASVTDAEQVAAMVERARKDWGGVHILINNAGILRDKTFLKMSIEDFRAVVEVHLMGAAVATKAVWAGMRNQNYGRILMTSSTSGLYGNFGQANYGAAKGALAGMARTLAKEGMKYDVRVNAIAPTAGTRMTEGVFDPEAFDAFVPEAVVPAALFLVSEEAPNDVIVGAGGGAYHAVHLTMTRGAVLGPDERTVEGFARNWEKIKDRAGEIVPVSGAEHTNELFRRLSAPELA